MTTITRKEPGKMRNSDTIPGIGKEVLFIPKRPDRLYGRLSRLLRGTGRSLCCSKTGGRDAFVYCPVRETETKSNAIV
jgi:hypothetical protein